MNSTGASIRLPKPKVKLCSVRYKPTGHFCLIGGKDCWLHLEKKKTATDWASFSVRMMGTFGNVYLDTGGHQTTSADLGVEIESRSQTHGSKGWSVILLIARFNNHSKPKKSEARRQMSCLHWFNQNCVSMPLETTSVTKPRPPDDWPLGLPAHHTMSSLRAMQGPAPAPFLLPLNIERIQ